MSGYHYNQTYQVQPPAYGDQSGYEMQQSARSRTWSPQPSYQSGYLPRAALVMTGVGALIGGVSAAAKNIRRVQNNEIDRNQAVADTAKEMAGAGLAVGLTAAVMSGVNTGLTFSMLGTAVLATGVKYFWDGMVQSDGKS